mmetsp:Transcript_12084/g.42382  ORF Transcript_12084/g.42382 Transcript_12084/m.42382 type:complete len:425 (-) Transcript_12084:1435-2709(-)
MDPCVVRVRRQVLHSDGRARARGGQIHRVRALDDDVELGCLVEDRVEARRRGSVGRHARIHPVEVHRAAAVVRVAHAPAVREIAEGAVLTDGLRILAVKLGAHDTAAIVEVDGALVVISGEVRVDAVHILRRHNNRARDSRSGRVEEDAVRSVHLGSAGRVGHAPHDVVNHTLCVPATRGGERVRRVRHVRHCRKIVNARAKVFNTDTNEHLGYGRAVRLVPALPHRVKRRLVRRVVCVLSVCATRDVEEVAGRRRGALVDQHAVGRHVDTQAAAVAGLQVRKVGDPVLQRRFVHRRLDEAVLAHSQPLLFARDGSRIHLLAVGSLLGDRADGETQQVVRRRFSLNVRPRPTNLENRGRRLVNVVSAGADSRAHIRRDDSGRVGRGVVGHEDGRARRRRVLAVDVRFIRNDAVVLAEREAQPRA